MEQPEDYDMLTASSESTHATNTPETKKEWIVKAMAGDFMPACVEFEEGREDPHQIIDELHMQTILHIACFYGFYNVVNYLVNHCHCSINQKNRYGRSPLHILTGINRQDASLLIDFLIHENLNVDAADNDGITPVMVAINTGNKMNTFALLERGANLFWLDHNNNSALYFAILAGNKWAFKMMIHHDNHILNKRFSMGQVSLSEVLLQSGHSKIARHLVKHCLEDLDYDQLEAVKSRTTDQKTVNYFNFEVLRAGLLVKTKCYLTLLLEIIFFYRYKLYLLYFSAKLVINRTNTATKVFSYLLMKTLISAMFLYEVAMADFSFSWLKMIMVFLQALAVVWNSNIARTWSTLREDRPEKLTKYTLKQERSVIHEAIHKFRSDVIESYPEDELCEVCLGHRTGSFGHCDYNSSCIENFQFYSCLFDCSVADSNTFMRFLRFALQVDLTNIVTFFFLSETHLLAKWTVFLYCLIEGVIFSYWYFEMFLCFKRNITYFQARRAHKGLGTEIVRKADGIFYTPKLSY